MDELRYIYRYLRNSILRILALLFGKKMPLFNKILVIAPHPDDEALGCGGLMKHLIKKNKSVYIVLLTGGENCFGDSVKINKDFLKGKRRELTRLAAQPIGIPIENIYFLDFKDGGVNDKDPEINKLTAIIDLINPDAVFVPHHFEGWNDHVQANAIMQKIKTKKKVALFEYCVWFWYTMPFNKVTSVLWKNSRIFAMNKNEKKAKIKAIDIYMEAKNEDGIKYSGDLPKIMLKSCSWRDEIYFKL